MIMWLEYSVTTNTSTVRDPARIHILNILYYTIIYNRRFYGTLFIIRSKSALAIFEFMKMHTL